VILLDLRPDGAIQAIRTVLAPRKLGALRFRDPAGGAPA
jgi:hypothetical protein